LAVEAEPVDHRLVGFEPEDARARISELRQWRHRPDLDKAKSEAEQCVGHFGVFVKAGGDPDRIGKIEAERPHPQPRIIGRAVPAGRPLQGFDGDRMSGFGIEGPEQRPSQPVE
jgi:hypothetical protein